MAELRKDVERIVREVLAQLVSSAGGSTCACPAPAQVATVAVHSLPKVAAVAPAVVAATSAPPARLTELTVTSRVVTLADIDGRLGSIRRVVVPPKAIVTPAVRDELLRRGVALAYARPQAASAAASVRLVAVMHGKCCNDSLPAAIVEGIGVEASATDCVIEATDRLARDVARRDTLGLLLTRHTAAGLCLANRHSGVRAICGRDVAGLAADVAAVGANLLVVNPTDSSVFQLKRLVAEFCRGPRDCPKVFAERLN